MFSPTQNKSFHRISLQYAAKGIAALCHLQKPPRIYTEKSLEEVLKRAVIRQEDQPGDRDDNLWVTLNDYKPPETQIEWEQSCFLDKFFHGYYCWPKMIKYSINKRERYTPSNMPAEATILYDRLMDKSFLIRAVQLMVFAEEKEGKNFDKIEFAMFKVD